MPIIVRELKVQASLADASNRKEHNASSAPVKNRQDTSAPSQEHMEYQLLDLVDDKLRERQER